MSRPLPPIRLRPTTLDDLPQIMRWVNDPKVMGYFAGHQELITEEQERAFLTKLLASPTDLVWTVEDPETGEYIGQCSINQIYWLARNGRVFMTAVGTQGHKGYGKAMLAALQEKAREHNLHKLWMIVREDNHSSLARAVSAGFQQEGLLRDEYFVQGRYHNMIRLGWVRES